MSAALLRRVLLHIGLDISGKEPDRDLAITPEITRVSLSMLTQMIPGSVHDRSEKVDQIQSRA